MRASGSSVCQRALDLVDALHGLFDVAFAHDLAVAFADLGTHAQAMALVATQKRRLVAIVEDLEILHRAAPMAALFESLGPGALELFELLFEAASQHQDRAVVAVLSARRPIDAAVDHLRAAARLGPLDTLPTATTVEIRRATEALLADLHAFEELLRVLDPQDTTGKLAPVPME